MIDIRKMIERDWMVEVQFFHRITGIDLEFFNNYINQDQDFKLLNVKEISSSISNE